MKNCKFALLFASLLVCLSLAGCRELPMDYSSITSETHTVVVGETLTLNVPLPIEKAQGIAIAVTDATHQPISVDYTAPNLAITGIAEGDAEVQIEFSAGFFYKKSHITIPVMVLLPQLEAEITSDTVPITYETTQLSGTGPEDVSVIKMNVGETARLTVKSAEADISVAADFTFDNPSMEVKLEGTDILLTAMRSDNPLFTATVSKEGFRDAKLPCLVEISAVPVQLSRPEGAGENVNVAKGKAVEVPMETNGELSVSTNDSTVATAAMVDGKLTVTGVTEGTCTVTVTAKKENYLDSSLVLTCTVTTAPPPPALAVPQGPYAQLIKDIIAQTNVQRANEGLSPLKYSTSLSKAAEVRAKETATPGYQEHTRPDGRRGLTAITDAGLGEYNATGENLAGADFEETGEDVVTRWMNSPPHRAAILLPEFKTIGVGIYYDGEMYRYCQLFTGTKL